MNNSKPAVLPATTLPIPPLSMNWKIILAFAFLVGMAVVLYFSLKQAPKKVPLGQEVGKEYWISVASAEIAAKTKDGKSWDVNNSGPDVFYEIWWKGNRVHQSSVCTDSLIAKWDAQEIDLGKILRTQRIEASKAGAIIKVGDDNNITIKVYDSDLAVNDLIDEFQIDISKLSGTTIDLGSGPTKQCQKLSLLVVPVE